MTVIQHSSETLKEGSATNPSLVNEGLLFGTFNLLAKMHAHLYVHYAHVHLRRAREQSMV